MSLGSPHWVWGQAGPTQQLPVQVPGLQAVSFWHGGQDGSLAAPGGVPLCFVCTLGWQGQHWRGHAWHWAVATLVHSWDCRRDLPGPPRCCHRRPPAAGSMGRGSWPGTELHRVLPHLVGQLPRAKLLPGRSPVGPGADPWGRQGGLGVLPGSPAGMSPGLSCRHGVDREPCARQGSCGPRGARWASTSCRCCLWPDSCLAGAVAVWAGAGGGRRASWLGFVCLQGCSCLVPRCRTPAGATVVGAGGSAAPRELVGGGRASALTSAALGGRRAGSGGSGSCTGASSSSGTALQAAQARLAPPRPLTPLHVQHGDGVPQGARMCQWCSGLAGSGWWHHCPQERSQPEPPAKRGLAGGHGPCTALGAQPGV